MMLSFFGATTGKSLLWDESADGLTVAGNLSVDGGTIKLDGNYPVGAANVALGDGALDSNVLVVNTVAVMLLRLTLQAAQLLLWVRLIVTLLASNNTAVGFYALMQILRLIQYCSLGLLPLLPTPPPTTTLQLGIRLGIV
jgi:hypothetical protein